MQRRSSVCISVEKLIFHYTDKVSLSPFMTNGFHLRCPYDVLHPASYHLVPSSIFEFKAHLFVQLTPGRAL
uniref:Uncharacterized protein n=1 Tax=Populus trichocarpa TaxID=3694 RepID=A0A3N7FDR0_POPTR